MMDQEKRYGRLRADRNELETLSGRPADEKTTVQNLLDCGPKIRDPANHSLFPKPRAFNWFKSGTFSSENQTPASSNFSLQDFNRTLEELRVIFPLMVSENQKKLNYLEKSVSQQDSKHQNLKELINQIQNLKEQITQQDSKVQTLETKIRRHNLELTNLEQSQVSIGLRNLLVAGNQLYSSLDKRQRTFTMCLDATSKRLPETRIVMLT
ncbi:hypothetical protein TWF751_003132 [Orbilia oligospora]|nr:hypothetical protein TWF751_003132 [Orbilia oligospora]